MGSKIRKPTILSKSISISLPKNFITSIENSLKRAKSTCLYEQQRWNTVWFTLYLAILRSANEEGPAVSSRILKIRHNQVASSAIYEQATLRWRMALWQLFLFGYVGFTIHVVQNLFDYDRIFNACDHLNSAAALIQDFNVHIEDTV
jgi:hypothetical protein